MSASLDWHLIPGAIAASLPASSAPQKQRLFDLAEEENSTLHLSSSLRSTTHRDLWNNPGEVEFNWATRPPALSLPTISLTSLSFSLPPRYTRECGEEEEEEMYLGSW